MVDPVQNGVGMEQSRVNAHIIVLKEGYSEYLGRERLVVHFARSGSFKTFDSL